MLEESGSVKVSDVSVDLPIIYDITSLSITSPDEVVLSRLDHLPTSLRDAFRPVFSDARRRYEYDRGVMLRKLSEIRDALLSRDFSYMFLGGSAGEIGRSMVLFNLHGSLVIVDAGLKYSREPWQRYPSVDILHALRDRIVAVFITHVHADHVGLLPLLARILGPDVKFYMTRESLAVFPVILNDALNIIQKDGWEDFAFLGDEVSGFSADSIKASVLSRVIALDYGQVLSFGNFDVKVLDARHIYGSASYLFRLSSGLRILYSGDIGSGARPEEADILFIESTYGDRDHRPYGSEKERFLADVANVLGSGHPVFIPSFALGRAQDLLRMLYGAMQDGRIPVAPIYVGGLAKSITGVIPGLSGIPYRDVSELGEADGAKVVIVSSNNMVSGISSDYAVDFIMIPSLIAITGHQDNESPAGFIYAQRDRPEVEIFGHRYPRRARIESYDFSAHAGRSELLAYINSSNATRVVLMHGELSSARALQSALRGRTVVLSRFQSVYDINGEVASFMNYWGIHGEGSPGFYCATCNSYLEGYCNAFLHSYSNPDHVLLPTSADTYLRIRIESRTQKGMEVLDSVSSPIKKLMKARVREDREVFRTRRGTFGFVSLHGFFPGQLPDGLLARIPGVLSDPVPASLPSGPGPGVDPVCYETRDHRVCVFPPVPVRGNPVLERAGDPGSLTLFNLSWILNRLSTSFQRGLREDWSSFGVPLRSFFSDFPPIRVQRNRGFDGLSGSVFDSGYIYRFRRRGSTYVLEVSSSLFYDPVLMTYLIVAMVGRLVFSNISSNFLPFLRSRGGRYLSPIPPEVYDAFQLLFYMVYYGDSADYLLSRFRHLDDRVLALYAWFKHIYSHSTAGTGRMVGVIASACAYMPVPVPEPGGVRSFRIAGELGDYVVRLLDGSAVVARVSGRGSPAESTVPIP
ncbi:MAG: MBL fold metallo-hydrolase [Bacteroidota bacterium]